MNTNAQDMSSGLLSLLEKMQDTVEDLVQENRSLVKENLRLSKTTEMQARHMAELSRQLEESNTRVEGLDTQLDRAAKGHPFHLPLTQNEVKRVLQQLEQVFDLIQQISHKSQDLPEGDIGIELSSGLDLLESIHQKISFLKLSHPEPGGYVEYVDLLGRSGGVALVSEIIPPRLRLQTRDGPKTVSMFSITVDRDYDEAQSLFRRSNAVVEEEDSFSEGREKNE